MIRIEPVHFQDTETDGTACIHSFQRRTFGYGGVRTKSRTAPFIWNMFSFTQSWHGRDQLGSRSSIRSTRSGSPTSGMLDGGVTGIGVGSRCRKEKEAQSQTSPTHHIAGSYLPSVLSGSPLACHSDRTTPPDVAPPSPPSPPTLAHSGYHEAQMKVFNDARAELMKGVRKLRYNDLVVERWVFSFALLFGSNSNFWYFGAGRKSPSSVKVNATALTLSTKLVMPLPSDSVEGMRVPRSPPYLSVLNESPPVLSNNLSALFVRLFVIFVTHE